MKRKASSRALGSEPVVTVALLVASEEGGVDGAAATMLERRCTALGHRVIKRLALSASRETIETQLRAWVVEASIDVILVLGGLGAAPSDVVPDAVVAVLDVELPGYGERVRRAHEAAVGARAMLGRECGGIAGSSFVFTVDLEPAACDRTWDAALAPLLDPRSAASIVPLFDALAARV